MKRLANKPSFKPTMEALETRWCPAATVSPLQNGAVTITGDDTANIVQITQNDNQNRLTVIADGVTTNFASDQVTSVVINLKDNNDQLTYQLGGGSDFKNRKTISVDLGAGNDTATLNFADNGAGGLAKVGGFGGLDMTLLGQTGKDQVDAFFGTITGHVKLTGNMGFGDDRFSAELKGSVLSYANLQVDMEDMNDLSFQLALSTFTFLGGNDDFRVTTDAGVAISKEAELDVTLKGFDGNDNLQLQYQGAMDGFLTVLLDGEDGRDTVTADIALATGSAGTVNATVLGGTGNDSVALRINDNKPGLAQIQGVLDGGKGVDVGSKTANVIDFNCEFVVFQSANLP